MNGGMSKIRARRRTPLGFYYVDIEALEEDRAPIRFTFKWRDSGEWEGRDYAVTIED